MMSRMREPGLSEAQTILVHTRERTAQEEHSIRTARLCETSHVHGCVNCLDSSASMANQTTKSQNHSASSSSSSSCSHHVISPYKEVPCLNHETPPINATFPEFFDGFDNSNHVIQHAGLASEEPLQIQCGENSALLYVSKLCQGSKGPCILFQNEWLTPNELQYISGRETAKDWKRSIRYKGRSLKSLISRGLLRVHPPMCDCSGCRISSPVNRNRLTSKHIMCPSTLKNRRDAPNLFSSWHDERIYDSQHLSSSDIKPHSLDRLAPVTSNAIDQQDSNSSTSECSEISTEESAFYSAGDKRPRNTTPPRMDRAGARKRRASDSASVCYPGQERNFDGVQRTIPNSLYADPYMHKKLLLEGQTRDQASIQSDTDVQASKASAFHAVLKDGFLTPPKETGDSPTCSHSDEFKHDALARTFERRGLTSGHTFFPPQLSQCLSPARRSHPGQNSSRFTTDPCILASQAYKIYQHAELQKFYMQYGLVAPMHQKLVAHNLQASAMLSDSAACVSVESSSPRQTSSHCASPVSEQSSWKENDGGRGETRINGEGPFCGMANSETGVHTTGEDDEGNAAQESQLSSPSSSENPISWVDSKSTFHKRVPRLHVDLSEDVLAWNADDVCHFVSSITRSAEVTQAFRDENIDGHSFVCIREEHLLDRMSVKLGPALKILAQINKLVENLEIDKESDRTGCKTDE